MQILMVSDVYFPRINGVSTSIKSFRDGLRERQHGVDLIVPAYDDGAAQTSCLDESAIHRVRGRVVPQDPEDRLMSIRDTVTCGAKFKPDLIHIHTPFAAHIAGMRIARSQGVPVLVSYHTLFEEYAGHYLRGLPGPLLRMMARRLSRHQCNEADHVIVPSEPMRARLADYGITSPMTILPTGIRTQDFANGDRAAFRRRLGLPDSAVAALFVGRVAHEKNIGFLIEALHRCATDSPELVLIIAGEGPATASLQRQVAKLSLQSRVIFVGYLRRPVELADCYAAADLFVFASRTETQGLVLVEAMAAGLPVLSLAEMGTRDILLGNPGALVIPDDVGEFARLLSGIAKRPAWRESIGRAAREQAEHWAEDRAIERLEELYRRVLAGVRSPAPRKLTKATERLKA
jgi:hypothetical protein